MKVVRIKWIFPCNCRKRAPNWFVRNRTPSKRVDRCGSKCMNITYVRVRSGIGVGLRTDHLTINDVVCFSHPSINRIHRRTPRFWGQAKSPIEVSCTRSSDFSANCNCSANLCIRLQRAQRDHTHFTTAPILRVAHRARNNREIFANLESRGRERHVS